MNIRLVLGGYNPSKYTQLGKVGRDGLNIYPGGLA